MNELSANVEDLVKIWLSWMSTANHRNDEGVSTAEKRKMAESGELLIGLKYQTVESIDAYFDKLKEKK